MNRYWAVFVPVVETAFVVDLPGSRMVFSGAPEVLISAASLETARDVVDEFVTVLQEGPLSIRSLGVTEEQAGGTRDYSVQTKGFLCLPRYEQPRSSLTDSEIK